MTTTVSHPAPVAGLRTRTVRGFALVSGFVGLAAGVLLVAFFVLANPYDATPGGPTWLGSANDALGVVQFAALAPVLWALRHRMPARRMLRVLTGAAAVAAAGASALSLLLVAGVLTFEQQIGPLMAMIMVIFGWLLAGNLAAHRTRALPRAVTRCGVLVGSGLLVGLLLVAAGLVTPGPVGQVVAGIGYLLGGAGWLALPIYVLLVGSRVFGAHAVPHPSVPRDPGV